MSTLSNKRPHYPDVSDAIEGLKKRQFIEPKLSSSLHSKPRQRRFFQLTRNGLQAFIDGKPSPVDFWKAMYWFCKLSEGKMDWNTFDALCHRFEEIYLGYTPHHWHFFQFRFIDILFKKWLKDNDKIYDPVRDNDVRGVVLSQRILECLGMNRAVTLGQLCQHIEEQTSIFEHDHNITKNVPFWLSGHNIDSSQQKVKRSIEEFTLSETYESPDYSTRPDIRYELDQVLNRYVDFIQHLVVISYIDEKGETRYELSLFGIALLLSVRACEYWNPERVFYNLDFEEFCAKLSANYPDKLPLVFGKWDSLIRETRGDNKIIVETLRNLFYGRTSNAMIESSVVLGGVREYYESAKDLSVWSYPKLEKMHQAGKDFLEELAQYNDCIYNEMFSRKVNEISNSLNQRNLDRFMGGPQTNLELNSLTRDPCDIYANEFVNMEKALVDEITFLFYIFFSVRGHYNFNSDPVEPVYSTYFPAIFRPVVMMTKDHIVDGIPMVEQKRVVISEDTYPLKSFVNIIRKHEDIKQMLVSWIDDAKKCQNDVEKKISGLKRYTQKG
jgi:hypothetical protein